MNGVETVSVLFTDASNSSSARARPTNGVGRLERHDRSSPPFPVIDPA
jgi:hypothetical protein